MLFLDFKKNAFHVSSFSHSFYLDTITFRYKLGIIKIIRFLIRQVDLDFQTSFLNFLD